MGLVIHFVYTDVVIIVTSACRKQSPVYSRCKNPTKDYCPE